MIITSLTNPYIKELNELKKNNIKKEKNMFLVDGLDFILLAKQNNLLKEILTLSYLEEYQDIKQIIVTKSILDKLSVNKTSSNVIGVCYYPQNKEIKGDKLLYLDGVQDPGNVGTLIRTALAFSYSGVILSKDTASIYNDKVISSTKGAIFSLPIYNDIDLISLKEKGYEIVSTSLKNAIDYKEYHVKNKFVLVLGNEGKGVKEENLLISDYIVKINMDNIDSLNVGVAGGILMNEYR